VTAREPDPPPLPAVPVGNAVGRADDRGVVKVAQLSADEASHQSRLPRAHADEHEEDDSRGSKRRRLLAALAASGQTSPSGASHYVTVTRNVTRTAARNDTMMRLSNGDDVITNDDGTADAQRRSKKQRVL
jgi:hypothetical protein